ncbi:Cellobiose dehydrogenase [Elsinoe australis]|uniref:Cellobiose dehydrogenase n=1 Tax=Elsinoe australis TaxID=40998 RepID=A0A2P7YL03_9PEZI|nr:Cellobiose dehydrogenase [Elsinoe australis]
MRASTFFSAASFITAALAQTPAPYTDASTGITVLSAAVDTVGTGSLQIGLALPPADAVGQEAEFIGRVAGTNPSGGWTGVSFGGAMTSSLLLVMWPNGDKMTTSFRFATGYVLPEVYTGNATITVLKQTVTPDNFEFIYRCQNCWQWDFNGETGSRIPAAGAQVLGWAQGTTPPSDPTDPSATFTQHAYANLFGVEVAGSRQAKYNDWISAAAPAPTAAPTSSAAPAPTATPTGSGISRVPGTPSSSAVASSSAAPVPSASACAPGSAPPNNTYDYIVVGGGAGGIPMAAKLSEAGKSVLLIERGPPSSGRWGGTMRPEWLQGTNLTRFDVPGLCNEIWADSAGIACPDASAMAGCVLGGGTAVNAALWWKANPTDFDYNFPEGWKSADMEESIGRVFEKIPWTDRPSRDGKLYLPQGYNALSGALEKAGWTSVTANDQPGEKHRTYSHTPYMYSNGERNGPMATYLVEADARDNFALWMNTTVARVTRSGSTVTGLDVEAFGQGGHCGHVNLKPGGRVILSAGVFGTSKILMRSGIGPADQLKVVAASSSDKSKMIAETEWIELPVGQNLDDHTNTDTVVRVPSSVFYDWYGAFDAPIPADKDLYLNSRTGPLTQSAPNIGPVFWEEIEGADGIKRQLQWTARVEGSAGLGNNGTMTISQYLGRGATSRGRLTITPGLTMTVSDVPYLKTDEDKAAVIQGIKNLRAALAQTPGVQLIYPSSNITVESFVENYPVTAGSRSANHWMGTAKMGTDSGLSGGSAVVDLDTKVYGTDNLFVVDASVFPGMVSTNPSALIIAVSERASERILALPAGGSSNSTLPTLPVSPIATPPTDSAPTGVFPTGALPVPTSAADPVPSGTAAPVPSAPASSTVPKVPSRSSTRRPALPRPTGKRPFWPRPGEGRPRWPAYPRGKGGRD